MNQSPIVPVNIERNVENKQQVLKENVVSNNQPISSTLETAMEVCSINSKKKIVSRYVEVTTKTIITYEDGSKKELTETENHTYK